MSVDFDRMAAHLPADQRKQLGRQYRRSEKNETTAFLSCFFLGIFGMHNFYLGEWGRGVAHLLVLVLAAAAILAGVLGALPSLPVTIVVIALLVVAVIWEIADLVRIDNNVRQRNLRLAESLIGAGALADSSALTDAVARLDGAMTGAAVGAITAADVSAAREMAGEQHHAVMEEFDSFTTTQLSDDPNATSPGAPTSWTETTPSQPQGAPADPSAADTLDMPAPEYVTHTHAETDHSVTDTFEYDRSPDATQPMPMPTPDASEATTWPDHPPLTSGIDVPDVPDVTDKHAAIRSAQPIADVEGAGAAPQYVTLPDGDTAGAATAAAPLAVDAASTEHDLTDTHPYEPQSGPVADVEVNPAHPVYVDLPGETYVPPVVSQPSAPSADAADAAGIAAGLGAGAAYLESQAGEPSSASEARPESAPTSGPLMKRIRMKRQIVVDGQVVREEVVEKLVPVDADTRSMVAEMDTQLGHASREEIAHMANLDPDTSLDLRQRTELPADEQ
jgi:TM2 domain